jgi:serine/threonine protein kinase/WD40 repeat protein
LNDEGFCSPCLFQRVLHAAAEAKLGERPVGPDSPGPWGFQIPTTFGDYEVVEQIGEGGMGLVFRAHKKSLSKDVAIKFMKAGRAALPSQRALFLREAELAAQLDHPNIISVSEVGERDGLAFLVMRLIEGPSLADYLAGPDSPRTMEGRLRLMLSVVRAVHHAHQRGIIHRDLKPGNILIDGEGTPFVGDFGLARWTERDSTVTHGVEGTPIGTPAFMAPEQVEGRSRDLTLACDIWSLGVMLYAIIQGRLPFNAATTAGFLQRIVRDDPDPPLASWPSLPVPDPSFGFSAAVPERHLSRLALRDLQSICLRCLEKEPSRRYPTAASLADDLERWLAGTPVEARQAKPLERWARWVRRHPAATGMLVLSVAVIAALATSAWQVQLQTRTERLRRLFNYVADMSLATRALDESNAVVFQRAMQAGRPEPGEFDPRGIEWGLLDSIGQTVFGKPWFDAGEPVLTLAADGPPERVVVVCGRRVFLLDTQARVLATWDHPSPVTVASAALLPNEPRVAVGTPLGLDLLGPASSQRTRLANGPARHLRISADGSVLVALMTTAEGSDDDQVVAFNPLTGRRIGAVPASVVTLGRPVAGKVRAVTWYGAVEEWSPPEDHWNPITRAGFLSPTACLSHDTRHLLRTTDYSVAHLLDLNPPEPSLVRVLERIPGSTPAVAFSSDDRFAAVVDVDGAVQVVPVDAATGDLRARRLAPGHSATITSLAFGTEAPVVFTGSLDGTVRRVPWDREAPEAFVSVPHHLQKEAGVAPTFSADGRLASMVERRGFSGPPTNDWSMLWNLERQEKVGRLPGEVIAWGQGPQALAWDRSGQLRMWDVDDPANPKLLSAFRLTREPSEEIDTKLADGGRWVVWVDRLGVVEAFHVETGRGRRLDPSLLARAGSTRNPPVVYLSASMGTPMAAVGVESGGAALWDIEQNRVNWLQHELLADVRFSPDGQVVAVTAYEGHRLRLFDGRTGRIQEALSGHLAPVTALAFSVDGRQLITGGEDYSLVIWNLATRREVFRRNLGLPIAWISVSQDSRWMITGHLPNTVGMTRESLGQGHYRLWPLMPGGSATSDALPSRPRGSTLWERHGSFNGTNLVETVPSAEPLAALPAPGGSPTVPPQPP